MARASVATAFLSSRAIRPTPHVRFAGAPAALGAAVYGQAPLARLETEGVLEISGDHSLAERFVTLFPLPERFDR